MSTTFTVISTLDESLKIEKKRLIWSRYTENAK